MFSNRLQQFIQVIGETPTSLESKIGVSKGAIYKAVKNGKKVGVEILEKILLRYPNLNLNWLVTGSGLMFRPLVQIENIPGPAFKEDAPAYHSIPKAKIWVVNSGKAPGWDGRSGEAVHVADSVMYFPPEFLDPDRTYAAFFMYERSMEPVIPQGAWVIGELCNMDSYPAQLVPAVILTNDRIRMGNLLVDPVSQRFQLSMPNPAFSPIYIDPGEITSLWLVRALYHSPLPIQPHPCMEFYQELEFRVRKLEKILEG